MSLLFGQPAGFGKDQEPSATSDQKMSRPQLAGLAKLATALVEVDQKGFGTAFCIDRSGLFLTNMHVVKDAPNDGINLILNPSLPTQKKLKARVMSTDEKADLALLAVEKSVVNVLFTPLEAGDDSNLSELTELLVFGFPFGTALAKEGTYPAISANVVNVSSLRNDGSGLNFIQLDSNLNPGNSGGPVILPNGKFVGIIEGGIPGAGINIAIPVSKVVRFLNSANLILNHPSITMANIGSPMKFSAKFIRPPAKKDLISMELIIKSPGEKARRYPMTESIGEYHATIPYVATTPPYSTSVKINYTDGELITQAGDTDISIGDTTIRLSDIAKLKTGAPCEAIFRTGGAHQGTIPSNTTIPCKIGAKTFPFPVAEIISMEVEPLELFLDLECAVVAKSDGKEFARFEESITPDIQGKSRLKKLLKRKFVQPSKNKTPVTFLRIQSSDGDQLGLGKFYDITGITPRTDLQLQYSPETFQQRVRRSNERREPPPMLLTGLNVNMNDWRLEFGSARTSELKVGEYTNAIRYPFHTHEGAPGISVTYNARGANRLTGGFKIWEIEYDQKNRMLTRLAVDFYVDSESKGAPLAGILRINSQYQ